MSPRRAALAALGLLSAVASGPLAGLAAGPAAAPVPAASENRAPFVLYYLHGTRRCRTCLSIEDMAERIVTTSFREQLEQGRLSWASINFDQPANRHFVEDFGLVSSSLVLVERREDGSRRFRVLGETWPLSHDEVRFRAYLIRELRSFLAQGA